jgi:hypothetical protein
MPPGRARSAFGAVSDIDQNGVGELVQWLKITGHDDTSQLVMPPPEF